MNDREELDENFASINEYYASEIEEINIHLRRMNLSTNKNKNLIA